MRRPPTSPPTTRRPKRSRSAVALSALALVAVGCGVEDVQQESAREEVQAHVRGLADAERYEVDETHCTDAAKTFFREEVTNEFTCAVRVAAGGCDWFAVRVDRERRRVRVALERRDAGCTLPV